MRRHQIGCTHLTHLQGQPVPVQCLFGCQGCSTNSQSSDSRYSFVIMMWSIGHNDEICLSDCVLRLGWMTWCSKLTLKTASQMHVAPRIVVHCRQYAPDVVPDMPQILSKACPRHAPDDATDMAHMMLQACPR